MERNFCGGTSLCVGRSTQRRGQLSECASPPTPFRDSFSWDSIFTFKLLPIPPRAAVLLYQDYLVTIAAERPACFGSPAQLTLYPVFTVMISSCKSPPFLKPIFTTNITLEEGELSTLSRTLQTISTSCQLLLPLPPLEIN
jgi:hypothetical protein